MSPIYLDYNATTPVCSEALEAMLPWLSGAVGNPSSIHAHGAAAVRAVEQARESVASAIRGRESGIVFTSGATEANNIVLHSFGSNVMCPGTEHKSVLSVTERVGGFVLQVDPSGAINLAALEERLQSEEDVGVVSVMLANNETGIVQRVREVADLAHQHGWSIHCDATQAVGKFDVDVDDLDVDYLTFSSHKIYGPQGVGALWARKPKTLLPLVYGGGQERGIRPGTMNVAGVAGFGAACERVDPTSYADSVRPLALDLKDQLAAIDGAYFISDPTAGLPNTLLAGFEGVDAEALLANTPTIAASTGSACNAAVPEPSHVLLAMGVDSHRAFEAIRLSLGLPTTATEVSAAASALKNAVERVRELDREAGK